ncbi:hypothetical protein FH972_024044 [Carpinus fangiana]|uniref:Uncharacterized protein n=1 Tax=Carpinus fangiana TaxID=176857 RepID=A0A5N6KXA8_9ROSI|nr:hypothetical protein FH972_024044 [Carpinus fangiana]
MPLTPPDSEASEPTRTRKRPAAETDEGRPATRRCLKRAKWRPSASYLENTPNLPLCPRVLREFDDRLSRSPHPSSAPRTSRLQSSEASPPSLKRFARGGGPSLADIRGYSTSNDIMPPKRGARPDASRSGTTRTSSASHTGRTSAYDPAFEGCLVASGVLYEGHGAATEPANFDQIKEYLGRRRASLAGFSKEDLIEFKSQNQNAKSEAGVMSTVFQTIIGRSDIPSQQNVPFGNLAPLTKENLTTPQPDFFDGSRPEEIDKIIRDALGLYIIPSTDASNPVLPNFFAEGKGSKGSAEVCKRQACYAGVIGARAMHKLRSYVNLDTAIDGNAYTICATYMGGPGIQFLTLYATHITASNNPEIPLEYYMTQLRSFAMTDSWETCRDGIQAAQNAREWAKEARNKLIAHANAKASSSSKSLSQLRPSIVSAASSSDELSQDRLQHPVSSRSMSRSMSRSSQSRTLSSAGDSRRKRKR